MQSRICALIALLSLLIIPRAAGQQNCPAICEATVGEVETGTLPSILEVTFILQWSLLTSGTGTASCLATCTPCKCYFSFSYQRWSGNSCWKLENNGGPTGTSSATYSRAGILTTLCDDPDYSWIKAHLVDCTTGASIYTKQIDLLCPCYYNPGGGGGGG